MKKFGSVLLGLFLLFANVPLLSAQEMVDEVQQPTTFETGDTYQQRLVHSSMKNISSVVQRFGVSAIWVDGELAKGYTLEHIYEGLLEKQQGGSYEVYMQLLYPHTSEVKVRVKRFGSLIKPVVTAAAKAAKPYVDDAVKAATPYVNSAVKATVNFTKNVADDVVQGSKSLYQNITQGSSVRNIQTNVSKKEFGKNLESNGWSKSKINDSVDIYKKDGAKYTTRNHSNQGSKTADYTPSGQKNASTKIRLGD